MTLTHAVAAASGHDWAGVTPQGQGVHVVPHITHASGSCRLAEGQTLRFANGRRQEIVCFEGCLRVSIEGQPEGRLLVPGDRYRHRGEHAIRIHALTAARLRNWMSVPG